ncbi:MAG: YfhO family protein [Rhodococcus sp.]|nr:YfhO family protein [Rhodococcus sp. (in: high G+C Gram-positive bacteria)]
MTLAPARSGHGERLAWGALVAFIVSCGFAVIRAVDPRYFYVDDTESGAVGNWIQLGHLMQEGQWFPTLVLDQWMAGNYPVEGQGGLFNPVQMGINYIAPSVDDMAMLAMLVKLGFSIVLAWGVYRVALEYGARPGWAAVAAASAPFTGFTLYFEQTSWVTSLIGMAWVVQAWASGIRYARGRSGPLPTFVFLYLAISVGYAHAALLAGVTLGSLMIGEYVFRGRWRDVARLAAVGIAAASAGAITFLPAILSSDVTWRTGEAGTLNDNFLTAPWSETLTASIPSSVSSIESWTGETTTAPITYIAWFVIPALAFIGWHAARHALRELTAPLLLLVFALLFTAGPSDIGQIRWPARLLPFVAVIVLILVVVLVSRFGTTRPLRPRLIAAGLLIVVLVLRASSSGPQYFGRHVMWGVAIAAFGALTIYLGRKYGTNTLVALLLVTIVPVVLYQVSTYPKALNKLYLPTSQSEAKAEFPDFEGTTLQLSTRGLMEINASTPRLPWHSLVSGNYAKMLDLDYVNAYTPVGHRAFSKLLCMSFEGSTCDEAYASLFTVDPYTQATFADLMRLDRVVLQREQYPHIDETPPPPGWHWVEPPPVAKGEIVVLERDGGPVSTAPGRVSATVGVDVRPISSTVDHERLEVTSPTGGSVVFARLAWPGYTATLDGNPLQTKGLGDMFLYVDIPPGTHAAELDIHFDPPGWQLGLAGMGFGLLVLLVLMALHYRSKFRRHPPERVYTPAL